MDQEKHNAFNAETVLSEIGETEGTNKDVIIAVIFLKVDTKTSV